MDFARIGAYSSQDPNYLGLHGNAAQTLPNQIKLKPADGTTDVTVLARALLSNIIFRLVNIIFWPAPRKCGLGKMAFRY